EQIAELPAREPRRRFAPRIDQPGRAGGEDAALWYFVRIALPPQQLGRAPAAVEGEDLLFFRRIKDSEGVAADAAVIRFDHGQNARGAQRRVEGVAAGFQDVERRAGCQRVPG